MSRVLRLEQMTHGPDFRAATLRDHGNTGALDPVLGIDHAWMGSPTFPPHSHVGFSAVSYVFADAATGLNNQDSIGTRNVIRPGGLHWTAAGRGIVHEEVPAEPGKTAHLFQIFISLPASTQAAAPFALSLEPEDVPVVELPGARIRVPLGEFGAVRSPLNPPTKINLLDVHLNAGGVLLVPVASRENAFVVPIMGRVTVNGVEYDAEGSKIPAFPGAPEPQMITLEAHQSSAQVAVFSGLPVRNQNT